MHTIYPRYVYLSFIGVIVLKDFTKSYCVVYESKKVCAEKQKITPGNASKFLWKCLKSFSAGGASPPGPPTWASTVKSVSNSHSQNDRNFKTNYCLLLHKKPCRTLLTAMFLPAKTHVFIRQFTCC